MSIHGPFASVTEFHVGDRVELHPATDLWMRGARFGVVAKLGRKYLTVEMDLLVNAVKIAPANIYKIVLTDTRPPMTTGEFLRAVMPTLK